jgi:tryptophan-rich sensory protein
LAHQLSKEKIMNISSTQKLVLSIIATVGLGSLGGVFTIAEIQGWYAGLNKPSFNPPNWIFGPMWTFLYFLMGISFYLIWKLPASKERSTAIQLFITQFVFNFCWSIIFFSMHQIGWAFLEIIAMWVFILLTILQFRKLSIPAAVLLIPYLLWVSFASILNGSIWQLN